MMELMYQVITQPGEDAYRTYAKVHIKSHSGRKPLMSVLVGVALIATALVPWMRMGFSPLHLITLAMGVLCLVGDPLSKMRLEKKLLQNMPAEVPKQEYRFDAEGFQLRYQGEKKLHKYSDVVQVMETQGFYFLYLSRNMAYILPKADFAQGQAQAFAAFLQQQNVSVEQVNI